MYFMTVKAPFHERMCSKSPVGIHYTMAFPTCPATLLYSTKINLSFRVYVLALFHHCFYALGALLTKTRVTLTQATDATEEFMYTAACDKHRGDSCSSHAGQ